MEEISSSWLCFMLFPPNFMCRRCITFVFDLIYNILLICVLIMEPELESRSKRKKIDKFGRFAAFAKLKDLKGSKHKYEVSQLQNVYDVVDEKEYSKQVLSHQDDDWIVDDDGTGYAENGRDIFDDDLDAESIAAACTSRDKKLKSKKRKAISENAGKGNLQYMLSNMASKKKEDVNLDEDDILSELIQEIDNVKTEDVAASSVASEKTTSSVFTERDAAKNYMKSFSVPKPPKLSITPRKIKRHIVKPKMEIFKPENILKEVKQPRNEPIDISLINEEKVDVVKHKEILTPTEVVFDEKTADILSETQIESDFFEDDFDMTQIEEPKEIETKSKPQEDITEEQLLNGWNTMQQGSCNDIIETNENILPDDLPLTVNDDGNKVFRFFWWDAFEDRKTQPGTVLLFGKTYYNSSKTYVSCCVAVRNIQRKIYLLPRTHFKSNPAKPVTMLDVYHEFNEGVSTKLHVDTFKSKKVTKNYAFSPEIPSQSEYLEVRYSAMSPPVGSDYYTGETYSKIFGINTNYLEILLLERNIKGPCWLEISHPNAVVNPVSWCKLEINCIKIGDISVVNVQKQLSVPPLVVATINMRTIIGNDKFGPKNEIVMVTCLVHRKYCIDKQAPNPPFQQHFCVLARPDNKMLPMNIHEALCNYKGTKVQKMDNEKGLLNYFISQFANIDPDLVVGHDLQGYQLDLLCNRLRQCGIRSFSRLSKIKRNEMPQKGRFEKEVMSGRLVCDLKISAKELIKSRSFDLNTLCQTVLKLTEGQRINFESEEIPRMYQTTSELIKLITLTMQDTAYILKMMYELNVIPLALQITNIAGNVMSRTLMGGRSERNEFLLLHAFSEKDYVMPDKEYKKANHSDVEVPISKRKKPTYSGGLVLDPKIGFYDKFILLMDFNSLYPSIIQEYNVCFTTFTFTNNGTDVVLPDKKVSLGVLPTEIRKLVESRRAVKQLMKNPDISHDLFMQYHIRQMALKLTANSMYGCLGFTNSRFFAKELAAFITQRGREILTNTKDLVEKMSYEVIYGDTDSIMINTNCLDYDQVFKVGNKIKQEVNKLYRQVELDIDGVFKYLLLLKKKKYAAVTITKTKSGELKVAQEHKGLDIVRRDWSPLSAEAGKIILNHILSDQSSEERIENIQTHLSKLKADLESNKVPLSLLVITKQLTKNPRDYSDKNSLPHVQVALRYNTKGGKQLQGGDTVPYIICDDGSTLSATQRAYHVEEYKHSDVLKLDIKYYLAQQIHPVISRLCEPIEGLDAYLIASWLGIDTTSYKKPKERTESVGIEYNSQIRFRNCEPFIFPCYSCKTEIKVTGFLMNNTPFLEKCANPQCDTQPIEYIQIIQNRLTKTIRSYIRKFYAFEMTCEDPMCTNETNYVPLRFAGKYPVCTSCHQAVMYLKYPAMDLHLQLRYFQNMFDVNKIVKKMHIDSQLEIGYQRLKECVDKILRYSGFNMINLGELFGPLTPSVNEPEKDVTSQNDFEEVICNPEEEDDDV